ncbi:MAG: DEAD/DEAH box helicase, partial [Pseudomonadota bacterium]
MSLDPWQQQVFDLLRSGESVVVDAPTTAGKTRAVEVFFAMNVDDPTFRAAYTTPVKSLSNDKVRELRAMFGEDKVGIATGDIKENLDAPIVVATLESYRNSLLGIEPDLGRTLVVFDEYHYLQDEGRGSAWEEAIILTPPSCQVLLLSASVKNAEDFADWISTQHKKRCTMVRTEGRPVPLTNLVYYGEQWLTEEFLPKDAFKHMNPARNNPPGANPSRQNAQHFPGLDTLRAMAILMVIPRHALDLLGGAFFGNFWKEFFRPGWAGVDLFFVLSGFLIGSQLLQSVARDGRVNFGRFYLKRSLRIMPSYYFVLLVYLLWPDFREKPELDPAWRFLLYVMN